MPGPILITGNLCYAHHLIINNISSKKFYSINSIICRMFFGLVIKQELLLETDKMTPKQDPEDESLPLTCIKGMLTIKRALQK
jgi:hypothetical protein